MDSRILVPLDGTRASEAVLRYVPPLNRGLRAEIVLFRSVTLVSAPLDTYLAVPAVSEAQQQASLVPMRDRLEREGFPCRIEVCAGPAAPSITAAAFRRTTEFIALSTHESGSFRWVLPGCVSTGVILHSPAPVFVVKPELMACPVGPEFRSLLVVLDPLPGSKSLLDPVCALAQRWGARIVFLLLDPSRIPMASDSQDRRFPGRGDPPVFVAAARESAVRGVRAKFVIGSGAHTREIVSASRKYQVDLIALSARQRYGYPRWLHSHVIGRFLRWADLPVLFLP